MLETEGRPIHLSIRGAGEVEVPDAAMIEELIEFIERLDTIAMLKERERRFRSGEKGVSLEEVKHEFSRRYGDSL